jgi:hypothetical protein
MPDNYSVKLSLSEAMLNRTVLEKELFRLQREMEGYQLNGNAPDANLIEQFEALDKLVRKL